MCRNNKVIALPVSRKAEAKSYQKEFSWKDNYEQLNNRLHDFLQEGNPNIYYRYKAKNLMNTEAFQRELHFQKELRKEHYQLTFIGRMIVILWHIDYLFIPGIKRSLKRKLNYLLMKINTLGKPKLTIQK